MSTHTLDHHGATPVGGLRPGYLFHIMDHHGADTVCVPIAATGERMVMSPSGPACHPSADESKRPSPFGFSLYSKHSALTEQLVFAPLVGVLCPALGEGWLNSGT